MRHLVAFALLGLVVANWMQGFGLCRQLAKTGDANNLVREVLLVRQLEHALHHDQTVKIVDHVFNGRRGWAYPGDFVYFAEVDGDTTRFILHKDTDEKETGWSVVHLPDASNEMPLRLVSVQEIFHNYIIDESLIIHFNASDGAVLTGWHPFNLDYSDPHGTALTHPPELV